MVSEPPAVNAGSLQRSKEPASVTDVDTAPAQVSLKFYKRFQQGAQRLLGPTGSKHPCDQRPHGTQHFHMFPVQSKTVTSLQYLTAAGGDQRIHGTWVLSPFLVLSVINN